MNIGILVNTHKETVFPVLIRFMSWLSEKRVAFAVNQEVKAFINDPSLHRFLKPAATLVKECDLVLSFGGDGTLLSTARLVGRIEKPILGVNIGKLGFLTEVEIGGLYPAVERLLAGHYRIEDRMVLETAHAGRTFCALNDFAIVRREAIRMIRVRVQVDDEYLQTYTADGLIIATPTGSTAYSLSASGPILTPTLQAIVINPICPHTLTMRPLVISAKQVIHIQPEPGSSAHLTADGYVESDLEPLQPITIRAASHCVKLIKLGERNFYDVLRNKLSWGEDIRKA